MKSVSAVKTVEQQPFGPEPEYLATLNETFDRFKGEITLHGITFHNILHAFEGIQAINRVILANGVAKSSTEDVVLDECIMGGFHAAIGALTNFSLNALEDVISKKEKAEKTHG